MPNKIKILLLAESAKSAPSCYVDDRHIPSPRSPLICHDTQAVSTKLKTAISSGYIYMDCSLLSMANYNFAAENSLLEELAPDCCLLYSVYP